jgi:hypothetical protein
MSSKSANVATVDTEVVSDKTSSSTSLSNPNQSLAFSAQDIEIPRLNVVQKMSEIEGPLGSIVIDKDSVLLEAEDKTNVIVVGAIKKWKEDVPYGDDDIPRIVTTQQAADELAGNSSYGIVEFAEIILLIPQVGDDDEAFPYPIGDSNYQLGRITVQKDAYRLTYKRLFTFQTFNPKVPVSSRMWKFGSELLTKGKYSWFVPTLTITKEAAPAEVAEFAARLSQGGTE